MDLDTNRNYLLTKLKSRAIKISDFDYDRLTAPPLWQFIEYDAIERLRKLATSLKYASKPVEKLQEINHILTQRGFKKVTGGTNRVVYKHLEYDPVLFKIAFDGTGIRDSPREYQNQFYYKPFVSKIFEVSPCGVIEEVEKGIPVTSRQEFLSIANDVYDVIRNWFIGERVMDDIGTNYFMNWALREGLILRGLLQSNSPKAPYYGKHSGVNLFERVTLRVLRLGRAKAYIATAWL